jgi:hypothetical protein
MNGTRCVCACSRALRITHCCRLGLHGPVKNLFGASDSQAHLFTLRSMAAGVVTGGIGALLGSPFQLLKVRMQTKGPAATAVGQQHDVQGLWHGLKQLSASGVKGLVDGASAGKKLSPFPAHICNVAAQASCASWSALPCSWELMTA